MDMKFNLKDGTLEVIPPPTTTEPPKQTVTIQGNSPVAELSASDLAGFGGAQFLGIPFGRGLIGGTYADLISGLVTKLIPAISIPGVPAAQQSTLMNLLAAWGSAAIANRVKFIGRENGQFAAAMLVAAAARPYTKPLIDQLLALIPTVAPPAVQMQQRGVLAQAQYVAAAYQTANPYAAASGGR